jgi:hypothetical protein
MPGGGPSQARGGTLTPAGLDTPPRVWYATAACKPNRLGSPSTWACRGGPARSGGMVEARRNAASASLAQAGSPAQQTEALRRGTAH